MNEIYMQFLNNDQIQIIDLIGLENYLLLCECFAGESIYFPTMRSAKLSKRNKLIKQDYKNCKDINLLSKKYNICERQIKRIVK